MLKIVKAVYAATGGNGTFKSQWRIVEGYLTRWRVEETIRFVKQSYGFENIRVMTYTRIRNMASLVLVSAYFATVWIAALDAKRRKPHPETHFGLYSTRSSFNSRPSCDGQLTVARWRERRRGFQFTPVVRRATALQVQITDEPLFQFTPVVRRATRALESGGAGGEVSIHARRATGDVGVRVLATPLLVSIHARRATGDATSTM